MNAPLSRSAAKLQSEIRTDQVTEATHPHEADGERPHSRARKLMRTPAAATYIGLSASTLEKLRLTGGGPAFFKLGLKVVVYDRDDLDTWLLLRRAGNTSQNRPK